MSSLSGFRCISFSVAMTYTNRRYGPWSLSHVATISPSGNLFPVSSCHSRSAPAQADSLASRRPPGNSKRDAADRKSTRLNSSHSLHDALPIYLAFRQFVSRFLLPLAQRTSPSGFVSIKATTRELQARCSFLVLVSVVALDHQIGRAHV